MKKLIFVFATLALLLPLTVQAQQSGYSDVTVQSVPNAPAGDLIKNGNFSDGVSHWSGDGRKFADISDPASTVLATPVPDGTGAFIELHRGDWRMFSQAIDVKTPMIKVTITYAFSAGTEFSKDKADWAPMMSYSNMVGDPGFIFGKWGVLWANPDKGTHFLEFMRIFGGNSMHTASQIVLGNKRGADRIEVGVAFPPGKGTVVIYRISAEPGEDNWFKK